MERGVSPRRTFRCGTSRRATTVPSAEPNSSSTGSVIFTFAQVAQEADQHRQHRSEPHRLLQGQQERLLDLLVEAKMHHGGRAQGHADVHEDLRDQVRALANTEAFQQSHRERKKMEMRFAHMKRIFRLDRLRLRGLTGARDEVLLTAQNLRRLVKFLCRPPPLAAACPT